MKILVVTANYPSAARPLAAIFNERTVIALRDLCDEVKVLMPRPYVPPLVRSWKSRWGAYGRIPHYELRHGVQVYRPAYLQVPRMPGSFCIDGGAFLWCRHVAKQMNERTKFDAVLSFDLLGSGGIAWRVGRDLGIPASGWATGGDVRVRASSSQGKAVIRAVNCLDLIFYQSRELLSVTADLLGTTETQMLSDRRHVILSRGVLPPDRLPKHETRKRIRRRLGITDDQVLVLSIARVHRSKGIFELIDAVSLAACQDPRIVCVVVGSDPAFDETASVQKKVQKLDYPRVRLLPACSSNQVWDYLCAADVFAFTSHQEGMPNSLLEAMAMGVPAVAFAIPPVMEIDAGTGAILLVPPFDTRRFSKGLLGLAASPADRVKLGQTGRSQVLDRFMVRKNMAAALARFTGVVQKPLPAATSPRAIGASNAPSPLREN
ncbi:MAG: glycosyltransferase family 4 protein [Candidatus Binatia bacterium]